MIDGLILTEHLLRKRFRNFQSTLKNGASFLQFSSFLHQSVTRRKLFENALFKPETFENAGFALKCGQKYILQKEPFPR